MQEHCTSCYHIASVDFRLALPPIMSIGDLYLQVGQVTLSRKDLQALRS